MNEEIERNEIIEENEEIEEIEETCADCGAIIEDDHYYTLPNGDKICESCFESDYVVCEYCGDVIPYDDAVQYNDSFYCETCATENMGLTRCEDCGDWFNPEYEGLTTCTGDRVCGACSDNYYYCEDCGEYYPESESNYNDADGCYYCDDCYSNHHHDSDDKIYSYHEFNNWELYKSDSESDPPFYIGFELETEPDESNAPKQDEALELIYNNMNAICAHDGSLSDGGFEIISHPQSFKYIMEQASNYKNIFEKLIDLGYKSHDTDTCGLHFHITRPENPDTVDRLWLIMETYKREIIKLSRRTSSNLEHWARFLSDGMIDNNDNLKALYFIKKFDKSCDRYLALNNKNEKTIEFRFFRGTLKFETFMACVEFINNLVTLCDNPTIPVERITWDKLTKGNYITQYVHNREIMTDVTPKDESVEIMKKYNKCEKIANACNKLIRQYMRDAINNNDVKTTHLKTANDFYTCFDNLRDLFYDMRESIAETLIYLERDMHGQYYSNYLSRLSHMIEYHMKNGTIKDELIEKSKELKNILTEGGDM